MSEETDKALENTRQWVALAESQLGPERMLATAMVAIAHSVLYFIEMIDEENKNA